MDTFFMFGFLVAFLAAVYFFYEARNAKKLFKKEHGEKAHELFELSILSEVSEKIGYSLSSKDIATTIVTTAEKLFKASSISFAIIENDHMQLVTKSYENVIPDYIKNAKGLLLQGIYTIDANLKTLPVEENDALTDSAMHSDTAQISQPQSYFNIPLVLNEHFTGMISVTSVIPHAYRESDMSMLYKIVNRAQLAIGRLQYVIETEKEKVNSMVKSLSTGAIFFTIESESLKLFTINNAAKRFLKISDNNPDVTKILASFNLKPNIVSEMQEVIVQKKSTFYRNVNFEGLKLNIFLTPVFSYATDKVIGVSLTMQDVTREHEIEKIRESFTNMMVHELRTPLTAIKGAVTLLVDGSLDEEDKTRMRLIIKNSTERLLSDVNDILDSAKIDAGKLSIVKVPSNINDVIRKATEEMSFSAKSRAISIENHLDDTIEIFNFDPVRIAQVVGNMLSNAMKFSNEGGFIRVYSKQRGDVVEIEVDDEGCGIPEDKMNGLFKPFSQANFDKRSNGTGLGLYISKVIVENHGGKIWLNSTEGEGTKAYFSLPIIAATTELKPPQASMAN